MKISVKVVVNAKKQNVIEEKDGFLKVWIDAPAVEGKANKRLVEILSEYYDLPKSSFIIKSGLKSRTKIIEIL